MMSTNRYHDGDNLPPIPKFHVTALIQKGVKYWTTKEEVRLTCSCGVRSIMERNVFENKRVNTCNITCNSCETLLVKFIESIYY